SVSSDIDPERASHTPPENAKGGPCGPPRSLTSAFGSDQLGEHEQERDDERVNRERLNQRETENHRAADLVSGARVAGDAVERAAGGPALADAAAGPGGADTETG